MNDAAAAVDPAGAPLYSIPDYRRGWLLGLLSGVARWLEFLALGIFAYQVTESPPLVALLAIVRVAPYAFLGFVVGALTDRYDRKLLLVAGLTLMVSVSAAMVYLTASGQASYAVIVATTLATGIYWLTDMPIRRRFMVDAVGPQRIGRAMGLDNLTNYGTRGFGPLIGGAVFQWFGVTGVFALNFGIYAICLLLALGLSRPKQGHATEPDQAAAGTASFGGTWQLLADTRMLIVLGITVVYNLFCTPFVAMIPVFMQKDFGFEPALIGSIAAFEGLGGVLGSLVITIFMRPPGLFAVYITGPILYTIAIFCLSLAMSPTMTVAALIGASIGGACFSATQYALIYTTAPPELRGRAFGLLSLGIGCGTLGLWNAGYLFKHYDSATAMMIMALEGFVPLVVLGLLALLTTRRGVLT